MKLATIERIVGKSAIPNADAIELVTVLGWQCLVQKGLYNVGDLCIYVPIDTTVDPTREYFKFLADKKNPEKRMKVETIKMRGVFSQGLVIPLSSLGDGDWVEGQDVAAALDVQKYEKDTIIAPVSGEPFPTDVISKTDEDNLRTRPHVLSEFIGEEVYVTLKMDGSSMTLICAGAGAGTDVKVCSRNLVLEKDSIMYKYVEREGIIERLEKYGKNIAIQGEFCGPRVNGNKMQLNDYAFYVFTVKDLDTDLYLGYDALCETISAIDCPAINIVPLLRRFTIDETHTLSQLQDIANQVQYITPTNKKVHGEGIVMRPVKPRWSPALDKMLSVKIINQNYKD
jgi:RNA ligase (TIGR02306 family)